MKTYIDIGYSGRNANRLNFAVDAIVSWIIEHPGAEIKFVSASPESAAQTMQLVIAKLERLGLNAPAMEGGTK